MRIPAAALVSAMFLAAACGSSTTPHVPRAGGAPASGTSTTSAPTTAHPPRAGTADVAYAGSTQMLNEQRIGPAFATTTGYAYRGRGGGSAAVAQLIKSGEYASNVFESVGGAPITSLGSQFSRYYIEFAASPLVVAYNPTGPFAATLRRIAAGTKPIAELFTTMARSGFRLGRTDPDVDPQGQGFLLMLQLARSQLHVPASAVAAVEANSQVFAETSLESTLQAGQLDAASAYLPQAVQMKLPYISLPDVVNLGSPADASLYATASITLTTPAGTVVTGKPLTLDVTTVDQPGESASDTSAAAAFVAYTVSAAGLAAFRAAGYTVLTPTLHGSRSGVDASILRELAGRG